MCLRSVHFVSSLRSELYVHFEILIHFDSLHFIPLPYISPTSAPHSISGFFIPLHKSTQSFHFAYRLKSTHKYILTQSASKAPLLSPTHCFVLFSRHPWHFPTHFQRYIFSYCDVSTPLSTFQVER